jgi:hypothetical protein
MPLEVSWSPSTSVEHCCASMVDAVRVDCQVHGDPFSCPDSLVIFNEVMNEYGLIIHDGTASYVLIDHCPWCGTRLAGKRALDTVCSRLMTVEYFGPPTPVQDCKKQRKNTGSSF